MKLLTERDHREVAGVLWVARSMLLEAAIILANKHGKNKSVTRKIKRALDLTDSVRPILDDEYLNLTNKPGNQSPYYPDKRRRLRYDMERNTCVILPLV